MTRECKKLLFQTKIDYLVNPNGVATLVYDESMKSQL